jgi:AP-4 complex subunit epsilon-1
VTLLLVALVLCIFDEKTGYLFCAEIMPPEHELQLMLVNTLRKVESLVSGDSLLHLYLLQDLESSTIPRICLALDALITSSTAEVIPAVQRRLHDLLSHNSSVCSLDNPQISSILIVFVKNICRHSLHVRRRAILAFRALSRHDPEIMKGVVSELQRRLQDPQYAVVNAALIACSELAQVSAVHICPSHWRSLSCVIGKPGISG